MPLWLKSHLSVHMNFTTNPCCCVTLSLFPTLHVAATRLCASTILDMLKARQLQADGWFIASCRSGSGLSHVSNIRPGQGHFRRELIPFTIFFMHMWCRCVRFTVLAQQWKWHLRLLRLNLRAHRGNTRLCGKTVRVGSFKQQLWCVWVGWGDAIGLEVLSRCVRKHVYCVRPVISALSEPGP